MRLAIWLLTYVLCMQEGVLALDSLDRDRALSCGGRDRSVRLWKVPEESHAIFEGKSVTVIHGRFVHSHRA